MKCLKFRLLLAASALAHLTLSLLLLETFEATSNFGPLQLWCKPRGFSEAALGGLRRCSRSNGKSFWLFVLPISKQNAGGRAEWSQPLLRAGKHSEFSKQRVEKLSWTGFSAE